VVIHQQGRHFTLDAPATAELRQANR